MNPMRLTKKELIRDNRKLIRRLLIIEKLHKKEIEKMLLAHIETADRLFEVQSKLFNIEKKNSTWFDSFKNRPI
jgi:hypothetical protein